MAKSYKVAVKTANDKDWVSNGVRFATEADAKEWGEGLFMRWTAVTEWEVQETDEEPNR
jgi:hypothetical protein